MQQKKDIYKLINLNVYKYTQAHIQIYINTYDTPTHIHTPMYTHMHIYRYTYIPIHMQIHINIHSYMYPLQAHTQRNTDREEMILKLSNREKCIYINTMPYKHVYNIHTVVKKQIHRIKKHQQLQFHTHTNQCWHSFTQPPILAPIHSFTLTHTPYIA